MVLELLEKEGGKNTNDWFQICELQQNYNKILNLVSLRISIQTD